MNNKIGIVSISERVKKLLPPAIDINKEDIVEWVWEVIQKIGTEIGYSNDRILLNITEYSAVLPAWLVSVHNVRLLNYTIDEELPSIDEIDYNVSIPFVDITDREAQPSATNYELQYKVENKRLRTNIKEGIIILDYKSIPIDKYAEPLIPEEPYYIDAVVWYIVKNYLWRGMVSNPSKYQGLFQYADRESQFYMRAAGSRQRVGDEDTLRGISNKYLKLLPDFVNKVKTIPV